MSALPNGLVIVTLLSVTQGLTEGAWTRASGVGICTWHLGPKGHVEFNLEIVTCCKNA